VGARLFLEARTRADRHAVTSAARAGVEHAGGWVLDARFYSNVQTVLLFALPASARGALRDGLARGGLEAVETGADAAAEGDAELSCSLRITFLHDEPDLPHPVPADG